MDSPFYGGSFWNVPSGTRPRSHPSPSVREIPVRYLGSEQHPSRSDLAVKIQKVFRGFLVRKSVKKVAEIRSEVEEIEKRISKKETIDLIGRDLKEKVKINEMLMNLLLRLDSVRGVDSGVRDCRKAVIKKAIALQEYLDAVVPSDSHNDQILGEDSVDNDGKDAEAVDQNQKADADADGMEDENHGDNSIPEENEGAKDGEIIKHQNDVEDKEIIKSQINGEKESEVVEDYDAMPTVSECCAEKEETSQTESRVNFSVSPESLMEACEGGDDNNSLNLGNNDIEADEAQNKEEKEKEKEGSGREEENTKKRELLQTMMEDNEKMMNLMAQLFERNEMQTRMLSSLSQRVEQLERAFLCERLRRKKKRHAAGALDCRQTSPDNKKCGKRE